LLHDNAPAHKAASVCQFFTLKKSYNPLTPPPPPPYSPDLSPPDYFLFPKLKMKLKGLHFADVAEIQTAVTDELKKVQTRGILGNFSETVRPRLILYTGCHRRNGPNFGRVFLMLNYTGITQNTCIQS